MKKYSRILLVPFLLSTLLFSCQNNKTKKDVILDLYSLNDLHGRISENYDRNVPGISKISTFLKQEKVKNKDGFVFLNTGDIWQDTYESKDNFGHLLTECMEKMGCEAFVLGNHEFDWGVDNILENKKLTKNCTFLAANVYNYPNEDEFASLGDPYKIIEREGVKIGIIGTIGSTQNTSITSSIWENLSFKETTKVVQNISDELRTKKDCDVVIWGTHADYQNSDPEVITSISPVSKKKYVDAVFNAHTHKVELFNYNDVPFVQAGAHGKSLGHIQLKVDKNRTVSLENYNTVGYKEMNYLPSDPAIDSIIAKYQTKEFFDKKDEVVGTLTSTKSIDDFYAGSLLAKATYDLYPEEMKDVDIVINNGARDNIRHGKQTRETIFNMNPFTNKTIVCKNIKGSDIINELRWNYYYKPDETLDFDYNSYYTVACIDYILLHKNENRRYNYFPSYNKNNVTHVIDEHCDSIVCNYLLERKTIDLSEFQNSHFKY